MFSEKESRNYSIVKKNNILFIIKFNQESKSQLSLIEFNNKVIYKNAEIERVVIVEAFIHNKNICLFDYILMLFLDHDDFFSELFDNPSIRVINKYLYDIS